MVSGIARSARLMIQAGVMALGALLVLRGELTSGGMIASSILLSRALAPIEQMLSGWRSLVQASECWQRLRVLLAHAPAGADALALPPPKGAVTLDRVTLQRRRSRRCCAPAVCRSSRASSSGSSGRPGPARARCAG